MKTTLPYILITLSLIAVATGCHKKPQTEPEPSSETTENAQTEEIAQNPDETKDDPNAAANDVRTTGNTDPEAFKFTVDTNIKKTDGDNVVIPILTDMNNQQNLNYNLDCDGDGVYEKTNLNTNSSCVFDYNTGTHQISLKGDFSSIVLCKVDNKGDDDSEDDDRQSPVISIDSWGNVHWKTMNSFMEDCENLKQIPESAPDLTEVTEMKYMFSHAKNFNQPVEHWDVSNVNDMIGIFCEAKSFNQPLEKWNVSNVKDMRYMFRDAEAFNQPLEKWDVSNVTSMESMFEGQNPLISRLKSGMYRRQQTWNRCLPIQKHSISRLKAGMYLMSKT